MQIGSINRVKTVLEIFNYGCLKYKVADDHENDNLEPLEVLQNIGESCKNQNPNTKDNEVQVIARLKNFHLLNNY